MSDSIGERRGGALLALSIIILIAVAWWSLALWPAAGVEPEWLARTRSACFGSSRGGLPDAGGWILLIGEPTGMIGVLFFGWRRSLRQDVQWFARLRVGRTMFVSAAVLGVVAATAASVRVSKLWAAARGERFDTVIVPQRVQATFPDLSLVDQHGQRTTATTFRGRKALVTFAYGHCMTVCPAVVNTLVAARREASREDVPIIVLTIDPWRDTPDRLPTIADHWQLRPVDRVLSGEVNTVERALDLLGVGRRRDQTTGDVDHAAVAMILDERGQIIWRVDGGPQSIAALVSKL